MAINNLTWEPYIVDGVWQVEAVRSAHREFVEREGEREGYELRRYMLLQEPRAQSYIDEYERITRITLPSAYRSFVLTVGDSGILGSTMLRQLGAPMSEGEWPRRVVHFDVMNDRLLPLPFDPDVHHYPWSGAHAGVGVPGGLLYLSGLGFAVRDGLVVTGPRRGQMIRADSASHEALSAGVDEANQPVIAGFAAWYCAHLDGRPLSQVDISQTRST